MNAIVRCAKGSTHSSLVGHVARGSVIALALVGAVGAVGGMGLAVADDPAPPAGVSGPRGVAVPPPHVGDVKTPPQTFAQQPIDPARAAALQARPPAQGPSAPPAEARPPQPPIAPRPLVTDRVLFDEPGDGGLWAMGRTYKCRFDASGLTYIPYLGSSAPRNFPIRFTLNEVAVAGGQGEALPLTAAAVQRQGDRVVIDRGSVQEVYLLSPDSIEQQFIFAARPMAGSAGDLALRIAVESELAMSDAGEALRFANDLGSVSYSKAVLVDADGQRTAAPTSFGDGGMIEIALSEAALDAAAYPLTVDPVIGTYAVDGSDSVSDRASDMVYDGAADGYTFVWERNWSATDGDVWSERYTYNGVLVTDSLVTIDFTGANWRSPSIANNNLTDTNLVVAEVGAAGARQVWGRTRSAVGNTVGTAAFQISDGAFAGEQFNAAVGGDPYTGGAPVYWLVVWERAVSATDHDVLGRLVDTATGATSGGIIIIENSFDSVDINPAVARSNGALEWTVVWERVALTHDILGSQVTWNGAINLATYPVDTTIVNNRNPAVSGLLSGGVYMVVYEEDPGGSLNDVYARVMNEAAMVSQANLTIHEGVTTNRARRLPAIDSNANRFVVAYQEQFSGSNWDVFVSTYCHGGSDIRVAEQHRRLDFTGAAVDRVSVASLHGSGGTIAPNEFMTTWSNLGGSGFGEIQGGFVIAKASCCISDTDGNGATDVDDLIAVILGWGFCETCAADINGEGAANVDDLIGVILGWGPCP